MPPNYGKIINQFILFCIRKPYLAVPIVGFFSSLILYLLRETSYPSFYIITVLAWLASDFFILFFIRGGNGIAQVPIFGKKSQFKGIAFIMFFISIFLVSIIVNVFVSTLTETLSHFLSDFIICLGIGFGLAGLVFVDLNAKYYTR